MTEEQKCIADLFKCIDDITEKAKRRDLSLFRVSGIGGCDMYQGCPPICRVRDDLLMRYEDIIYQALKENMEMKHDACCLPDDARCDADDEKKLGFSGGRT